MVYKCNRPITVERGEDNKCHACSYACLTRGQKQGKEKQIINDSK